MNKLYLLAALAAAAHAAWTVDGMTDCDYSGDTADSGDYAYTWKITDLAESSACNNDFVFDFNVDGAVVTTTTTDDSTSVYAYGIAGSGKNLKKLSFEDSTYWTADVVSDYFADVDTSTDYLTGTTMTSDYDGGILASQYDVSTKSSGDKSANAAGWTVIFYNSDSTAGVDITGSTDNALLTATTALTFAGVAGLFF